MDFQTSHLIHFNPLLENVNAAVKTSEKQLDILETMETQTTTNHGFSRQNILLIVEKEKQKV
jgi:hypothetical protein